MTALQPVSSVRSVTFLLVCVGFFAGFGGCPLTAQIFPYPGGGYPGGGYPGGRRGPGFPFPRRGGSRPASTDPNDVSASFSGTLRKLESKTIVVELADNRFLEFERSRKTKFYKESGEVKASEFQAGDSVSIDATRDQAGALHALKVRWQKTPPPSVQSSHAPDGQPDSDRPVLRHKDEPAQAEAAAAGTQTAVNTPPAAPPSSESGADRPVLQRREQPAQAGSAAAPQSAGIPTSAGSSSRVPAATSESGGRQPVLQRSAQSAQAAAATPAAPLGGPQTEGETTESVSILDRAAPEPRERVETEQFGDPVIEKARRAAGAFSQTLPDYVCEEFMARFATAPEVKGWQPIDVVSSEVVYEGGHEDYRNLTINGKAVKKGMEQLSGSWSTGEFGTILQDLFSPATAADFRVVKRSEINGQTALVYDFQVEREHSHWHIQVASQTVIPAYKGSVWIDPATGRVLRIEMQARGMPEAFPTDQVETAVDYDHVYIGGQRFLLPVHAETLSCQRGTRNCSRNVLDFRNCHKYSSESDITFERPK